MVQSLQFFSGPRMVHKFDLSTPGFHHFDADCIEIFYLCSKSYEYSS